MTPPFLWRSACTARTATSTLRDCRALLAVAGQEIAQPLDGAGKVARPRQRDDPQVIRCGPIESGSLSDQNLLRQQQIQDELFVVDDLVHLGIEPWERVEG